jgi:hypothetical protein
VGERLNMTNIISLDLAQKLFDVVKNNVIFELGRKDLRLFATLSYKGKVFHEEFLEIYNSLEELESSAKVLSETFICEYTGEILNE